MSNGAQANAVNPQGMTDEERNAIETYKALRAALTVAEDMLILARLGLVRNPSPDERRALDVQILELAESITRIDAKMDALIARRKALSPPSREQVESIKALASKVDELTRRGAAASATIALGTKVLEMAGTLRSVE